MNWDAVGAIGEVVGGVGVIASLLYLAVQTPQNTRAVRVASFHQVSDSFSELSLAVVQDPSLASLLRRVRQDLDSLTPEDTARYELFLLTLVGRAESMFFHSEQGALQRVSWVGIHRTLELIFTNPMARRWWSDSADRFNPTFRTYIDDLRQGDKPAI